MIQLVQTCPACPEQYDAYKDGKQVGYLRLRWGHFAVHAPDAAGRLVFSGAPEGDGIFVAEERDIWLRRACAAIEQTLEQQDEIELNYEITEERPNADNPVG